MALHKNIWIVILLALSFIASPRAAWAQLDELPFFGSKFPFDLKITDSPKLKSDLEDVIKEQRKQSLGFEAIGSLRAAARFDRDVIGKWMQSQGYFSYRVQSSIDQERITHTIESGPAYTLAAITFDFPPGFKTPELSSLPLQKGDPMRAEAVLAAQSEIRAQIHERNCLYEIQVSYQAEINRETHQGFVQYTLKDSPDVTFGKTTISGQQDVDGDYLKKFLTYEPGDCFKRKAVETSRLALLQTNLLARVEPSVAPPDNGTVAIKYEVTERSPRTIKAGIGYDTSTEVGYLLGWEHRNLLGAGEKLDIELETNKVKDSLTSQLVKQHFLHQDQTLTLNGEVSEETTDAYLYTAGKASISIDRPLYRRWAANIGVALEYSRDENEERQRNYFLISTPLIIDFNRSNQLLNPTRGWAMSTQIQPFQDLNDTNIQFNKLSLRLSAYINIKGLPASPILALRWAVGDISGEALTQVPSAHRYYVGGGGSVRGYGYQMVGELKDTDEADNVPTGGLSFSEASMELRLRHSKNWGSAIFVDGGYAYPGDRLSFGEDYLWGAGVGVRFFTSFAPIRLDIATPLDPRTDEDGQRIDDSVQLYIGIGQAF